MIDWNPPVPMRTATEDRTEDATDAFVLVPVRASDYDAVIDLLAKRHRPSKAPKGELGDVVMRNMTEMIVRGCPRYQIVDALSLPPATVQFWQTENRAADWLEKDRRGVEPMAE